MISTEILSDELASSYVSRICRLNGMSSANFLFEKIDALNLTTIATPKAASRVELLAALSKKSPQNFFAEHTVLPFNRAFRPQPDCLQHGQRDDPLDRYAHAFPCIKVRVKFCPSCVGEDHRSWGVSYWRRSHQFPGVVYCEKHRAGLHQATRRKWSDLPFEGSQCEAIDGAVVADAANNPVILRYTEICSALAKRDCPIPTQQVVQVIGHQLNQIASKLGDPNLRLSQYAMTQISGPWQRYFYPDLAGVKPNLNGVHSLDRTGRSDRMAFATHFYALALAVLFDTLDQALNQLCNPTVPGPCRQLVSSGHMNLACPDHKTVHALLSNPKDKTLVKTCDQSHGASESEQESPLAASARAFLAGASIQEACHIHGVDQVQLEELLRAAFDPLCEYQTAPRSPLWLLQRRVFFGK